jgi:hypothetical protein
MGEPATVRTPKRVTWYYAVIGPNHKPRIEDILVPRETSDFWKVSPKAGHFPTREAARQNLRERLRKRVQDRQASLHRIPAEICRIQAQINRVDDL